MTFDAHPRVSNRPPRPLADRQPPNISHGQRAPPTGRQPLRCLAPPPNELRMFPTPLRPSGFSRQPPSGGLNLAIKAYCLAGPRLADGLSVGPGRRRGVACVASAGGSGGSGGGGGDRLGNDPSYFSRFREARRERGES